MQPPARADSVPDARTLAALARTADCFDLPVGQALQRARLGWPIALVLEAMLLEAGRSPREVPQLAACLERESSR